MWQLMLQSVVAGTPVGLVAVYINSMVHIYARLFSSEVHANSGWSQPTQLPTPYIPGLNPDWAVYPPPIPGGYPI